MCVIAISVNGCPHFVIVVCVLAPNEIVCPLHYRCDEMPGHCVCTCYQCKCLPHVFSPWLLLHNMLMCLPVPIAVNVVAGVLSSLLLVAQQVLQAARYVWVEGAEQLVLEGPNLEIAIPRFDHLPPPRAALPRPEHHVHRGTVLVDQWSQTAEGCSS